MSGKNRTTPQYKPNWANRTLFHGDNLDFLRDMNSGTVDLIATDPPFNKGRDFHATPDSLAAGASFQDRWSWERDLHPDWMDQIKDDWPHVWHAISMTKESYGEDMAAFLCFMAVRLVAMRRVLKDTGSIYLHCDPTASHYLKLIMDSIFGARNFRNEIIWSYRTGGSSKYHFAKKHDVILRFTKTNKYIFNSQKEKTYTKSKSRKPGIINYGQGNAEFFQDEIGVYNLVNMRDVWEDIPYINSMAKERTGYPTQKPIQLYERIIKASSNEGDVVLDPFCGCATTLIAAEKLKRKWVGIDIWAEAHEIVIDRLKKEGFLTGPDDTRLDLLVPEGNITYLDTPPKRTDGGDVAIPYLRVKHRINREPPGPKLSRADMIERLLKVNGAVCEGCNRMFDDTRYLEIDHNTPRADGGINHISNRILLCGPCNKIKSNILTLSGLRRKNKKLGHMRSG